MTSEQDPRQAAIAARQARAAERARVSSVRRLAQSSERVRERVQDQAQKHAPPKVREPVRTATRAPDVGVARDARVMARAAAKSDGDQRLVLTGIIAFLTVIGGLAIVLMINSMKRDRAKVVMDATFARVHTQQQSFRMLNRRFASWPELKAAGATLPKGQRVAASNADASHWFMSIFDQETDLICDRTGELWDESSGERSSVCRPAKP